MSDSHALEAATLRLSRALEALEQAAERVREDAAGKARLTDDMHLLDGDRARLAAELDHATSRAKALEAAGRDVSARLEAAMGKVRALLAEEAADATEDGAPDQAAPT